jgi:vacuolar-type H+-ATPase subunit H
MEVHKQISEDVEAGLLKKVRSKEEHIEKALQETRLKASQELEKARKEAEETIQKAKASAQAEAEHYKESRKKTVIAATEKILSEARIQADKIHQQAEKNFDHALQLIFSCVLPTIKEKSNVLSEASS